MAAHPHATRGMSVNVSRLAIRAASTSSGRQPPKLSTPRRPPDARGGFSRAAAGRAGANRLLSAVPRSRFVRISLQELSPDELADLFGGRHDSDGVFSDLDDLNVPEHFRA